MSVANRLKRLLDLHGDSFAKAEVRTGVSRETIRRIANGQEPPKLAAYLRQIAAGYGVEELALLEGATPKGEFEWIIRHAAPAQRLEWILMSPAQRVKLTLDFLRARYPQAAPLRVVAAGARLSESDLTYLLKRWEFDPPDRQVALRVGHVLHDLTGIPLAWFQWGSLSYQWREGEKALLRFSRWTRSSELTHELAGTLERALS